MRSQTFKVAKVIFLVDKKDYYMCHHIYYYHIEIVH